MANDGLTDKMLLELPIVPMDVLFTHVGAPEAWEPRLIDTADMAVATPLIPIQCRFLLTTFGEDKMIGRG
ncbi:hypothetical protein TNCV_1664531 [Trichonephila clavipes]|uniref:Uncharacterized protein n=1 Tax=Trichonephila clavipes TaxID=2585209 RepID=A0A8X6VAI4_TRICX|nr:hypothetical protein TNCV_1664531 [Trichonephila clavipes]